MIENINVIELLETFSDYDTEFINGVIADVKKGLTLNGEKLA